MIATVSAVTKNAQCQVHMIRVAMSDDGPIDGATGIDVKVARIR